MGFGEFEFEFGEMDPSSKDVWRWTVKVAAGLVGLRLIFT